MKSGLLGLLLLVGVLVQGFLILGSSLDDLKGVRATLGMPAVWRSAYFSQGKKFADYVLFLSENIPTQGRVVLPPTDYGPKFLGITPVMQFFLAPRQVLNCPDRECAERLSPENTYLIVIEDFPGEAAAHKYGQRLMFNEQWGLLQPHGTGAVSYSTQPGFSRIVDILVAALAPVAWLGALSLAGVLLAQSLAPGLPTTMQLGLGYGLGLSMLTIGLGLAWQVGAPLREATLLWATALLLLFCLTLAWFQRRKPPVSSQSNPLGSAANLNSTARLIKRLDPWLAATLLMAGLAAVIGTGKGYFSADEIMLWGVKGYGIAATGTLANIQDWGTNTVVYPLHIPVLIAAFKALFGETLPAAKLAFSGYYLALLLTVYPFLVWQGLSRRTAGLATLLLATVPLVFRHATIAYANLPVSFYLVAAVVVLCAAAERKDWVIPTQGARSPHLSFLLSGLLFAAAAWTRPEGIWLAALGILSLLGLAHSRRRLPALKQVALLLLPLIAYAAFWMMLRASAYTRLPRQASLAENAIADTLAGDLPLDEAAYIVRSLLVGLFSPSDWGVLGFALILVVLVGLLPFRKGSRRRPEAVLLLSCGSLYILAVIGMYILTAYDTVHDISWWVSTGLDRMAVPAMILLWLGGVLWAEPLHHDEDRPGSADLEDHRRA
jgi:hypothetical protein